MKKKILFQIDGITQAVAPQNKIAFYHLITITLFIIIFFYKIAFIFHKDLNIYFLL